MRLHKPDLARIAGYGAVAIGAAIPLSVSLTSLLVGLTVLLGLMSGIYTRHWRIMLGNPIALTALLLFADWAKIQRNFFQPEIFRDMLPEVLTIAAKNTVIYTAIAFAAGFVLALALALMKLSPIRPYRWFATSYSSIPTWPSAWSNST